MFVLGGKRKESQARRFILSGLVLLPCSHPAVEIKVTMLFAGLHFEDLRWALKYPHIKEVIHCELSKKGVQSNQSSPFLSMRHGQSQLSLNWDEVSGDCYCCSWMTTTTMSCCDSGCCNDGKSDDSNRCRSNYAYRAVKFDRFVASCDSLAELLIGCKWIGEILSEIFFLCLLEQNSMKNRSQRKMLSINYVFLSIFRFAAFRCRL